MTRNSELEAIRWAAKLRGVSVKTLARSAGVEYERAGRLLRGERKPRPGELERLFAAACPEPKENE